MNRTLIYIDDILADMGEDTVVALTLQSMPIGDIKRRAISHTNRIKLPPTATNNQIFEHANNHHSKTRKPYSFVDIKAVQNGLETLPNAIGLLQQSGDEGYSLDIYDNVKGFFEAIKGKYVDEINLGMYGPFDDSFITTFKNATSPGGAPVIDYGRMLDPEREITNKEFDAVIFDPWENPDDESPFFSTGRQWEALTGDFIGVNLQAGTPENVSIYLHGPFKFYKGLSYRLIVLCEVVSGTTDGSLQLELHSDERGAKFQAVGSQAINAVGDHVFDQNITADDNFDMVAIIASKLVSGTTKEVILKSIRIQPIHVIDIKPPYYLPTLSYLSILVAMIENAGFEWGLSFAGADNTLISGLNLTFSKPELKYNSRLIDKYKFIAHADGTQVEAALPETPLTLIAFDQVDLNGSEEWYNPADSEYEIPVIDFDLRIRLFIKLTVDVTALGGTQINFFLTNGVTLVDDEFGFPVSHVLTGTGVETFTLELPATVVGNTAISYSVKANANGGGTNSVKIMEGTFYSEIDPTPVARVHASNLILPDMLQSDFFADFLYRFGCMVTERNSSVDTIPLQHVIAARSTAKNWTLKRDRSFMETIRYVYQNYGKRSYLSDSPAEHPDAKGVFLLDNEQLEDEKIIYTSPFVVPDHVVVGGIKVVRVPVFDFESNDPVKASENFPTGARLVYMRPDASTDPTVNYNGSPDTAHNVAVYDDPASAVKANWQHFIDNYYSNLQIYLDQAKVITRSYFLNDVDIVTMDMTKLIYDNGAYYKVEKIHNYIPGSSTKVELFKVS